MAGNNELDNAVLGGSSDYLADLTSNMYKVWFAKDDEKVIKLVCVFVHKF